MINIFGVIVFLRSGWIVAQAGVINAVLIVLSTGRRFLFTLDIFFNLWCWISVGIALISVLSAVGICERCRIESGGAYK